MSMTQTHAEIKGAYYRPPAQQLLDVLPVGHELVLQPEPTNPYDKNAVKVLLDLRSLSDEQIAQAASTCRNNGFEDPETIRAIGFHAQLGYVAKEIAAVIISRLEAMSHTAKLAFSADGKPQVQILWGDPRDAS